MHQIPTRRALEEGIDDLDVGDAGELGALLGEAANVVKQGLVRLLTAPSKILRVPRAHVSALEVAHEGPEQVIPVVDLVRGKVFEPCPRRVCKVQRKVADDHGDISRTAQLASQAVVVEPETGICLSRVFGEGGGLSKAWGKWSDANFSDKHAGAWGFGDGLLSSLIP